MTKGARILSDAGPFALPWSRGARPLWNIARASRAARTLRLDLGLRMASLRLGQLPVERMVFEPKALDLFGSATAHKEP